MLLDEASEIMCAPMEATRITHLRMVKDQVTQYDEVELSVLY